MADDLQASFTIELDAPLPKQLNLDEQKLLDLLQGNILKGHGRNTTTVLLLGFGEPAQARRALAALAPLITPASRQLAIARALKKV